MPVQTIPAQEVFKLRQGGKTLQIIDVRTPAEYAQVHAEGARSVPLDQLDPTTLISSREGANGEPLFIICKTGGRAAKACQKFQAAGFQNVMSVEGGTTAWEQAGLPVVRGTRRVISLERQVRIAAGSLVLLSVLLGWRVHPAFLGLSALVGTGLAFSGITDWCGMGMLLAKMPWNREGGGESTCSA